mgnify:CR=1 FL=1
MKIFNTMTKKKEEFVPLEEGKVKMYVCGPTVYNFIHIGNARPMIVFDTVRRYFEYKGYDVNYVSNFTDVDDKIIKKAIEEGVTADEISKRYIAECKKDMDGMNIKPEARIAATYDLMNDDVNSVVTLANGSAYTVNGEALDRFGMELGVGVTAEVNDNVELSLGYEGKFRQDYQDHTGLINAKYKF